MFTQLEIVLYQVQAHAFILRVIVLFPVIADAFAFFSNWCTSESSLISVLFKAGSSGSRCQYVCFPPGPPGPFRTWRSRS